MLTKAPNVGQIVLYNTDHNSHSWGNGLYIVSNVDGDQITMCRLNVKTGSILWARDVTTWKNNKYLSLTKLTYTFDKDDNL